MPFFKSIHGRQLGFDQNNLLLNGRIVGNALQGRGKYVYVDSNVDAASGANPSEAVGTLDEAFALCTANVGDTIVVMPKHAETVTGVGGIAHDVAGVSVIGLGTHNQRPTFLMDGGTTVTYVISAADAYIENLVFVAGHSNVATCFGVTAVGAWINKCSFKNNTTNEDFLRIVSATGAANTADGLRLTNNRWLTTDVDDLEFLAITDNIDALVVDGNYISTKGTASPLILQAGTKVMTSTLVTNNLIQTSATGGDLILDNGGSANYGICAFNLCGNLDTSGAQILGACTGFQFFENYFTSTSVAYGALDLAADTPIS